MLGQQLAEGSGRDLVRGIVADRRPRVDADGRKLARVQRLLLAIVLDDAGVADRDIVRVEAELPLGPALAQEVPALVQRFFDLPETGGPRLFERLQLMLGPQFVFLGH